MTEAAPKRGRLLQQRYRSWHCKPSSSASRCAQVDQWLDYAAFLTAGPGLEAACAALDAYLALRSFLVGFNLTIADLACWGQLESVSPCVWQRCMGTSMLAQQLLMLHAGHGCQAVFHAGFSCCCCPCILQRPSLEFLALLTVPCSAHRLRLHRPALLSSAPRRHARLGQAEEDRQVPTRREVARLHRHPDAHAGCGSAVRHQAQAPCTGQGSCGLRLHYCCWRLGKPFDCDQRSQARAIVSQGLAAVSQGGQSCGAKADAASSACHHL